MQISQTMFSYNKPQLMKAPAFKGLDDDLFYEFFKIEMNNKMAEPVYDFIPFDYEVREKNYETWRELNKQNETVLYLEGYDKAQGAIDRLFNMSKDEKEDFVRMYEFETGFPNLEKINQRMESEIVTGVHNFANDAGLETKFIGYDIVNSVGRKAALPGSDCDGIFVVVDSPNRKLSFHDAEHMRIDVCGKINQRIVATPFHECPEILTIDFLNEQFDKADELFKRANFTQEDLDRFEQNLDDSTNDFVKSGEFNIRLARQITRENSSEPVMDRDKLIKASMFAETLRYGKILENNLPKEFLDRAKNSPLYKYSNLIKQKGLMNVEKEKHKNRKEMLNNISYSDTETQFELIRDIILRSMGMKSDQYKNLHENTSKDGADEMGNIVEMYELARNWDSK